MKISTKFFLLLPALVISNIYCASSETRSALEVSQTPLMQSAGEDNIEKLIQELDKPEVNINAQDTQGRTALFIAAQEGKADNVNELIKRKADINIADNDGMTPLQAAVTRGDLDTVNALLDACGSSCPVLEQRDKKLQFTPLARAARSGNSEIIKLLLAAGANPMAQVTLGNKNVSITELIKPDDKEASALIQDKVQEYTNRGLAVIKALKEDKLEEARKLLAQGIDVNAEDKNGTTPLHWAASKGHIDIVKRLIDSKADVNAKNRVGYDALYIAVDKGRMDIVKLLIDNRADINATQGYYKVSPLHLAIQRGHKDIINLLIKSGADVNAINQYGRTALHRAVAENKKDIVNLLIDKKADVNIKADDGYTPLGLAVLKGHQELADMLRKAGATK